MFEPPGGLREAWCCRVPGRVCSPQRPTTPSSPSLSPVWFSTLWERPTSASWWTFTVSHAILISPCSVACGPLYSLHSGVRGIKHCCVSAFLWAGFPLLVLLHYYSSTTTNISLSVSVSSRPNSVGRAAAKNGRCWRWCHPQLQMGWKPSAHTHLVQKGFKHGKKRRAHAGHISALFLYSHHFHSSLSSPMFTKAVCHSRFFLCHCCIK